MTHPAQNETIVDLDTAKVPDEASPPEAGAPQTPQTERLYGGQYKTVEELEAAYQALSASQMPEPDAPIGPATIDDDDADDDDAADALAKAGLNLDDFAAEFTANGALSDTSYQTLAEAGFPKELVDVYVEGLRARMHSFEASVYAPVGGKEGYEALIQWAKANVSDEHKRVFNDAIQSGDKGRAALAVQALIALRGGNGRLLTGKPTTANPGVQPYASQAQAVAAVQDPRYRRDAAYRAEHEARLAISPLYT